MNLATRLARHEVAVAVLVPHVVGPIDSDERYEIGCGCGASISVPRVDDGPAAALDVWVAHAAAETGLAPELLQGHALARVRAFGTATVAFCSCGDDFVEDTLDPGVVIQLWAEHVTRLAGRDGARVR